MERTRVLEFLVVMGFIVLVFIMILVGLNIGNSKTTSSTISNSYNIINLYNTIENPQKTYYNKESIKITQTPKSPCSAKEKRKNIEKPIQRTIYSNSKKTIETVQTRKNCGNLKESIKIIKKPVQKTRYYVKNYNKSPCSRTKKAYYYNYEPKEKHLWDWGEDIKYKDYDSYGRHIKEDKKAYYADTYRVYVYNDGKGDYFTVRFYFEDYWGNEKIYDMRKYIGFEKEGLFYFRDLTKESDEYYNWRYEVLD